jgi:hypothetical protein
MKRINWLVACLVGMLCLMSVSSFAVEPTKMIEVVPPTPPRFTPPVAPEPSVPYTTPAPVTRERMDVLQSRIAHRLDDVITNGTTQEVHDLAHSLAVLRTASSLDLQTYTVQVPCGVRCSIPKDVPSDLLRAVMLPIGEVIAGRNPIIPDTHPMTTKKKPQSPDIKVTVEQEGMIEADQIPEPLPMRNHRVYFPLGDLLE